jgi:hypothetical protein
MKNLAVWIFVAILLSATFATGVHLRSMKAADGHLSRLQPLYEKQPIFPELRLALEKYRRASGNFRKMYNAEIASSKNKLRNEMGQDLDKLDQLDATDEERELSKSIQGELEELLRLSSKYEPQLFLKDAYQKPDVEELHNTILKDIDSMERLTETRLQALLSDSTHARNQSLNWIAFAELGIIGLVLLLIVRTYLIHTRPTRKLRDYALALSKQLKPEIPKRLSTSHREVAGTLADLDRQAEMLRDQRKKFIEDIVEDLRPGLAALKRSQDLEGALAILSASLEDLKNLAEISQMDKKVVTGVIDLSELLMDTCKRASLAGICPSVKVSVPDLPTWVRMDPEKIERALIQVLSKLGETLEKDQKLEAALQIRAKTGTYAVEIILEPSTQRLTGAPEQEILRHWLSQKGLALMLAQKVVKAHGGSIFAAGLAGGPVQISIKFPKSILTDGLVSPARYSPPKSLDVGDFNTI